MTVYAFSRSLTNSRCVIYEQHRRVNDVRSFVYLKSLVIKGFKSFADRSAINFEPGISVIVGPNGSGKSNISEAIMWVLGERNARNLRVQSLEELIFSGSSARQAVSVAEVDLVLDNSDHTLPIEFNQVAVTRRMYRSGESEYFINNSPCRRMDIIDVLFDTGLGQATNSIIGQGNLTAVLESRPEDRRELVEDAAGVLKHKKRKERAARKLDAMDVTLSRVDDIVKIIESQLRPLERQAQRARLHEEYVAELKDLDLSLVVDDLRQLQSEWNQLSKRGKEIEAEAELAHFRLNERQADLAKRQVALEEKGLFVGDINEQRIRCLAIIQRLDAGMLLLEEKGKNLVSRLSDLRATIHNSRSRLSSAEEDLRRASTDAAEGEARLEALYAQFNDLGRQSEIATRHRKEVEERYNDLVATLRGRHSALDAANNSLAKTNDSISSIDLEEQLLQERFEQIDDEFTSTQSILALKRGKLDELDSQLAKAKRESELAKNEIDKFVRILDERRRRREAKRNELSEQRAAHKALEEIDRAYVAASPALSWVLERKESLEGIIGPLSQSFGITQSRDLPLGLRPADLERLVERLLASDLFALLVRDGDAARVIAESIIAEGTEQGAISLLPLDGMRSIEDQSVRGDRLLDYLEYPAAQHRAFSALLGDIYLAEDISEAQKFHLRDRIGVRFVTKDGAIIWPNGKMTLGTQTDDIDGVLERRRKMESLEEQIDALADQLADMELEVSGSEKNLEKSQQEDLDISQGLARLSGDVEAATGEVVRLEESMTRMLAQRDETQRKLGDARRRRESATPLVAEYEQRIEIVTQEMEKLEEDVQAAAAKLAAATEEKTAITDRLSECKINLEASKGTTNYSRARIVEVNNEIAQLKKTLGVSSETERSLDVIRLRIDPLYKLYAELHSHAKAWAGKLQDQALLEQTDSSNLRKVINEATAAVDEARDALDEINTRRTAVLVEQGKLESSVQHAMQRIINEYGTSIEAALEVSPPQDRTSAEERVNRLRSKIANLGAVNHVAMEEYQSLQARRDYILGQIEDLREARRALAKISAALDKRMRNQFIETFEQVNRNFQEIFAILFPGGKGQLVLTEGATADQVGIEVSAQPQGKKILKLSMMSGGEKSLVALALLFAVYRIRSVPFYVLDEVEAALDDTNLQRLLDYLDHLRDKTQLILVSHQRRTMERADVLYGVTMQAAGVSKIVSQRLDEALGYASQTTDSIEGGRAASEDVRAAAEDADEGVRAETEPIWVYDEDGDENDGEGGDENDGENDGDVLV
jgi:chromosome segregation protein